MASGGFPQLLALRSAVQTASVTCRVMVGDLRVADGAEIDRVEAAQGRGPVRGHQDAVLAVIIGAPREFLDGKTKPAVALGGDPQHLEARGNDFLADAVARNGSDPVFA